MNVRVLKGGEAMRHRMRCTAGEAHHGPMCTRRAVLSLAGSLAVFGIGGPRVWAQTAPRVVVVGGGFGGATCAKYIRRTDPTIAVTLVEPHRQFITCPFSNAVLAGLRDLPSI